MSTVEQSSDFQFRAEIRQLLDILVHSLYKEQDIFLRELISNASDALTQLNFEMLTNKEIRDPALPLEIRLEIPETEEGEPKQIVIKDTGIGMTREELIQNLGTIAQSGAREFLRRVKEGEAEVSDVIGQFGVGFYSVFMVADQVKVVSLSHRQDAAPYAWISRGDDTFQVEPAEKEERGTEIHVTLKSGAEEFANAWKLRQTVKKHSDYIAFPIYVGDEQANQQTSLWRRSPLKVEEEEYHKFYQQLTMDFQEPLATVHFSSDAPIYIRALLFVPTNRERNVLSTRTEPGVKLYTHNVMIQEYCTDLLPKWLDFVDGVVDSEDLPLNVSRESVQNTRIMRQLAKIVTGRVLRELERLAAEESEQYQIFWKAYSRRLKEGLATDPTAKDDILPLYRCYSSKSDGELISLDTYLERMPEDQEAIYYVLGDDPHSVQYSPHLDPFKARDIEVLYWVDPLDPFVAPVLDTYKDTPLRNIDDADLELPELPSDAEESAEPAQDMLPDKLFNQFVGRCVTTLGDRIVEVRASKVLKDSPVRLVAPEDAANREFQRVQRFFDENYEVPQRILEVNRKHPLIQNLAQLLDADAGNSLVDLSIEQLYDSALIQEGLHPNPTEMLPRIQQLLELAAGSVVGNGSTKSQ